MAFFPSFAPGTAQGLTPPVNLQSTGTSAVFGAGTTGDTNNRVQLGADGVVRFSTGAIAPDTTIFRNSAGEFKTASALTAGGNLTVQGGVGITMSAVGARLQVKGGSNATIGTGTLAAGTATIATTAVTANSRVFITDTGSGSLGALSVGSVTPGTGFVVNSSLGTDTSTFNWFIVEQG